MAFDGYILTKGFEGTSKKQGHPKGSSIVHAVSHLLETPTDIAAGAVTHRRQHGLLQVELLLDAAVYQYYQATIDKDKDGSKKLDVEVGFFRTNQDNIGLWGGGEAAPFFTINLADAFVASVEFVMGDTRDTGGGGAAAGRNEYLRVKFAYRGITWTYKNGNKSCQDSWDGAK